jgi:predicted nucleic acid-binding protein
VLVVVDSSALIALAVCDGLSLLDDLFETIRAPSAVFQEVVVGGKPHAARLEEYLQGRVEQTDLQRLVIAAGGLGRGELEAMALYRQLCADLLLLDDRRARTIARLNEIQTVGSLGVLLFAKRKGLVPELRPLIEVILQSEIHLGKRVAEDVLRLAGEQMVR